MVRGDCDYCKKESTKTATCIYRLLHYAMIYLEELELERLYLLRRAGERDLDLLRDLDLDLLLGGGDLQNYKRKKVSKIVHSSHSIEPS